MQSPPRLQGASRTTGENYSLNCRTLFNYHYYKGEFSVARLMEILKIWLIYWKVIIRIKAKYWVTSTSMFQVRIQLLLIPPLHGPLFLLSHRLYHDLGLFLKM